MAVDVSILIIGAGFSGLGAAIRLKQEGIHDFLVLERGRDVGGTWRDNVYPGAACDIPSHLYSFSFEPRSDWSRAYPQQQEIQAYLRHCARKYGIDAHLHTGVEVVDARYDDAQARWTVRTAGGGTYRARVLISAIGFLRDPAYPPLPGRERFTGVQMHTSRWDPGVDLRGQRVAVVGTGASAVQVVPELAGAAAQLHVFQRTPAWIIPRRDRAYTRVEKAIFRHVPGARSLNRALIYLRKEARFVGFRGASNPGMRLTARWSLAHLRRQVRDAHLRAALTPDYAMGCKRILISNDFYPAISRPDVHLVTDPIAEVTAHGLRTDDRTHIPVDAIIYATGFRVGDVLDPMDIHGLGGRSLREVWSHRPRAYLGTTVPGFPNFFMLLGPNTGLGQGWATTP